MAVCASNVQISGACLLPKLSAGGGERSSIGLKSSQQRCSLTTTTTTSSSTTVRASQPEGFMITSVTTSGGVKEVCKDSFWPLVEEAGDKVVVLDMYTQWCGPCKVMLPKIIDLSTKYSDVVFFKLDCNQDNKPLATELGIRVVPTFKILKHRKVVAEITGAKFDELVRMIEQVRTPPQ